VVNLPKFGEIKTSITFAWLVELLVVGLLKFEQTKTSIAFACSLKSLWSTAQIWAVNYFYNFCLARHTFGGGMVPGFFPVRKVVSCLAMMRNEITKKAPFFHKKGDFTGKIIGVLDF